MTTRQSWIMALPCVVTIGLAPGTVGAAELDGKSNIICAATDVVACAAGPGCVEGSARSFELPEFMLVDVKAKIVHARTQGDPRKVASPIRVSEITSTQLVLQGLENGRAWSMTIDQNSGRMTTTVSGEAVSFMIFGACTAL